jgi:hypothetical protein
MSLSKEEQQEARLMPVLRMFFQLLDDPSIRNATLMEMMQQLSWGLNDTRAYFDELRQTICTGYSDFKKLDEELDDPGIAKHGIQFAPSVIVLARFIGNSEVFKNYPSEEDPDRQFIPDREVCEILMSEYRASQYY